MSGLRDHKLLLPVVSFLLMLSACGNQTVFQTSEAIPEAAWKANHLIRFEVEINDTVPLHELYLLLRNTTDYPYNNLFLFVDIEFPDKRMLRDTLECILADRGGEWTGKGFGKIRSNRFLFRDDVWFPQKGTYHFRIQHGMREEVLHGIADVGLQIDRK